MKKWSKEIHRTRWALLLTNYLRLGFSVKFTKHPRQWFHINLGTCQLQFYKKTNMNNTHLADIIMLTLIAVVMAWAISKFVI